MARTPVTPIGNAAGNGTSRTAMPGTGGGSAPAWPGARNRARITGGVLLLAVSALAAALIYGDLGDRRAVLAVARPVAAGSVVEAGDLTEVRVAAEPGVSIVAAAERSGVVGRTAKVALVPGSLLAVGQTVRGAGLPPGTTLVGATLKPGQFPVGLRPGDRIIVVVMPPEQAPSALDADPSSSEAAPVRASLVAIEAVRDSGGSISVSLAVPTGDAPEVAVAGARGRLVLLVEAS